MWAEFGSISAAGVTFSVMGFSMGAFAAQHLAVTRPDRVLGVVLIGGQGTRETAVAVTTIGPQHSFINWLDRDGFDLFLGLARYL